MWKILDKVARAEYEEYARTNPPPDMEFWEVYHPVCREIWLKRGFASELGKVGYIPSIIGYIDKLTGSVLCPSCAEGCTETTSLYDINILPYTQDCHACGDVIWFGESKVVLFPRKDEPYGRSEGQA